MKAGSHSSRLSSVRRGGGEAKGDGVMIGSCDLGRRLPPNLSQGPPSVYSVCREMNLKQDRRIAAGSAMPLLFPWFGFSDGSDDDSGGDGSGGGVVLF